MTIIASFIESYIAWIKDMLSSPDGQADELRVAFMMVEVFYLVSWAAWMMTDGIAQWPNKVFDFTGGQAAIVAALSATVRIRGDK